MAQLTFKWPATASYAPEDFIVSQANEEAVHFLETWPTEHTAYTALLIGTEASGKTHLAHNWATRVQAVHIAPDLLGKTDSASLWKNATHAVLEDINALQDETALFHLLRHAETHSLPLLLTSRLNPPLLSFTLPDLRSRLLAMPAISIHSPDHNALKAFLFKCFTDRQLRVGDDVLEYCVKRMERSFSSARNLVERIEEKSLETKRIITVPMVKELLK